MPDELLNREMSGEHINELVKHGITVFEETLRRNLTNFLQDGYLPFTKPLTGRERKAFLLSPEAMEQAAQMMQSDETAVRGQGAELMEEIVEARQSNGNS